MNPPPLSASPLEAPRQSQGCSFYLGIFMAMFLMVFFAACVVTYVMPKRYESMAIVQAKPSAMPLGAGGPAMMTPQFMATEFEVIRAQLTLKMVVQRLGLTSRWGMTEDDAVATLRGIIDAQNIRGTDLISITVKHTYPEDARDIAKEVYLAYKARREDKAQEIAESALQDLEKLMADQADVVEEKRKQRDNLMARSSGTLDSVLAKEAQSELESQQKLLEGMNEKLVEERMKSAGRPEIIILHEEPILAQFPSSPNVNLNLAMGAGLGVLLGAILAFFVRLFVGRRVS